MFPTTHSEERVVQSDKGLVSITVSVCDACNLMRSPGDWPACPHEIGHFGEEPLEPYIDEHISDRGTDVGKDQFGSTITGTLITTRAQRRRIMNQENLEFRKKRTDLLPSSKRYFDLGRK